MWPNLQFPADLVTFIEEIFSGNLHFLWSASQRKFIAYSGIVRWISLQEKICSKLKNNITEKDLQILCNFSVGIYLFKVNNRNTKIRSQSVKSLTSLWYLTVIFEQASHIVLVFPLLTLNKETGKELISYIEGKLLLKFWNYSISWKIDDIATNVLLCMIEQYVNLSWKFSMKSFERCHNIFLAISPGSFWFTLNIFLL